MLKDENVLLEIQTLIDKCEQSTPIIVVKLVDDSVAMNIAVHQIKKYIRTGKMMRLNA